ncbi:MAG: S49 family peptidase [Gammaproteobacteria bacterium]|nr:MAG: S49 family peptidase [Gammaproteobacteria bacterium]
MADEEWIIDPVPDEPHAHRDGGWERRLVTRLAEAALQEQRRARRWGIFFKLLFFGYLVAVLVLVYAPDWKSASIAPGAHTALVRLDGLIAPDTDASADNIITGLRHAFEARHSKGVVLRINSPGGSPVQADYINKEIRRLRKAHPDKRLYAVVSDLCASGGYYVAVAADKIYVNENSLVGSIGVRMDGFGFVEAIRKLGIERRLLTAGEHKGLLDPFLPEKPEEVAHVRKLLQAIHREFIDTVKAGRGDRLKNDPELFSGLIWTGRQAVALGLADDFGSVEKVAREVIKAEDIVDYTPTEDVFAKLADRLGTSLGRALRFFLRGSDPVQLR